jgi:hypothetical protein
VVRVDPEVYRALKADDESELICLIVGALPIKGFPKNPKNSSLIDDGVPDWDHLPPWCEGNKKIIELNKQDKKASTLEDYALEIDYLIEDTKKSVDLISQDSLTRFDKPKNKKRRGRNRNQRNRKRNNNKRSK